MWIVTIQMMGFVGIAKEQKNGAHEILRVLGDNSYVRAYAKETY